MANSRSTLVYRTDAGRICPACQQPLPDCRCRAPKLAPCGAASVRVSHQTKGRAGKGVTLVKGLGWEAAELQALVKQLKVCCASGGTLKDGVIEVQGDHVRRIIALLQAKGLSVKRSGG